MSLHAQSPVGSTIVAEKFALRTAMRERRAAVPEAVRQLAATSLAGAADAVMDRALDGPIAGYWPTRSEIDVRPLLTALSGRGRTIALPVTAMPTLLFRRHVDGKSLEQARFGLLEPPSSAELVTPGTLLVPLLAFDRRGGRLGYGAGHYDTAIAMLRRNGRIVTIGVAFAVQEVPSVPREAHDVDLDHILTERGLMPGERTGTGA